MGRSIAVERPIERRAAVPWLLPALVALFFLSGVSGLIYQVLWLRLLALVFGVTIYAASTVLASFMGGLALGSYAAGRLVDRARNPLRWYGVAEVLVGLSALATPAALRGVERLYVALHPALPEGLGTITLVRFLLSSIVLLVPTTLMGATLPIVIKSSLLRAEGLGQRVGLLYATNTAGAIAGTVLAGFVLIGGLGIWGSFLVAAALNVAVGLAAIAASGAGGQADGEAATLARPRRERAAGTEGEDAGAGGISETARRLVLVVFVLSGFASLALEVIWFRVLVLFLPSTTYAFTTMLATVLAGIAAGSYLVTPLMRRRLDWLGLLAVAELAIGVVALASFAALGRVYDLLAWAERTLAGRAPLMLVASVAAIFPATLLMGLAFPVGLRLWAGEAEDEEGNTETGERIGLFYSLNVCGAIAGSLAAGFLLLPWLGSRRSLIAVAGLGLVSGLLLLAALPRSRRGFALGAGAAGTLLFALAAWAAPDPAGVALARRYPGETPIWREEGLQTTVSVHQADGYRVLYLDGHHQANDTAETVAFHRLIGHLPMALHPAPREVLVIGLGGGATPGAMSRYGGAEIDVVELSGSVARGAAWFGHVNDEVLRRPNVRLRVDDGRNYLLLTPRRYDVITADVIRPYHAGAGNLYSLEYYQLARDALADDGLMVQWVDPASETQYRLIARTFQRAFPHTTAWAGGRLLIGTKRPLQLDPADFARKLADPATRAALESAGFGSFEALLAAYTAGPDELRALVGDGPLLTDDRPLVEYFLSLPGGDRPLDLTGVRGDVRRHVKP